MGNFDCLYSKGTDIIVPDLSDKENDELVVENESPRTLLQTLLMSTDTSQTCKSSPIRDLIVHSVGLIEFWP